MTIKNTTAKGHLYAIGKLDALRRLPSSKYGNPRFEVEVLKQDGTRLVARTSTDSMLAYGISNYFNKTVQVIYRITPKGRVILVNCTKL